MYNSMYLIYNTSTFIYVTYMYIYLGTGHTLKFNYFKF